jgi:hypothetical protein
VESVETRTIAMNVDKTGSEQKDQLNQGLPNKKPSFKWPPPMPSPTYHDTPSLADAPSHGNDLRHSDAVKSQPAGSPLGPGMRQRYLCQIVHLSYDSCISTQAKIVNMADR